MFIYFYSENILPERGGNIHFLKLCPIIMSFYMKNYYVYLLANKRNGTLYTGSTSDLVKRIWEHKNKVVKGFTAKYDVTQLVYYEICNDINVAIQRENQIKRWRRQWKLELIEKENPHWVDLYQDIIS